MPKYTKKRTYKTKAYKKRVPPRLNRVTGGYLGLELKYTDQTFGPLKVNAAWTAAARDPTKGQLSDIIEGTGPSQRIGRKITLVDLHVKGQIIRAPYNDSTNAHESKRVRVICVIDRQTNAAVIDPVKVFDTTLAQGGILFDAFRNLQYNSRYTVIYDKVFDMNVQTMAVNASGNEEVPALIQSFEFKRKLGFTVLYSGVNGGVSQITDRTVHMLAVVDEAQSQPECLIGYESRIRFRG